MKYFFFYFVVFSVFVWTTGLYAQNGTAPCKKLRVSINNTSNIPFSKMLAEVQKQTGYMVTSNCSISVAKKGVYKNVGVEELFRRILQGENVAVFLDDRKCSIDVRCIGSSSKKSYFVDESGTVVDRNKMLRDPLTDLPWPEAEKAMGLGTPLSDQKELDILASVRKEKTREIESEIGCELKTDEKVLNQERQGENERDVVLIDPQTGLSWKEAEQAMGVIK